jgi:uncharacterized protein
LLQSILGIITDNCAMTQITSPSTIDPTQDSPASLLVFPSTFPIKVMGHHTPQLLPDVCAIAAQFDPSFQPQTVELRPSKAANYLGITLYVLATSKAQLDDLYRALSSHPLVKVVL